MCLENKNGRSCILGQDDTESLSCFSLSCFGPTCRVKSHLEVSSKLPVSHSHSQHGLTTSLRFLSETRQFTSRSALVVYCWSTPYLSVLYLCTAAIRRTTLDNRSQLQIQLKSLVIQGTCHTLETRGRPKRSTN